jgi:seryl-tRNA synthetase
MFDNDELLWLELERVRLPSPVLARIEELAEERRRLLQALPDLLFERERVIRRIAEIDLELERLWDLRRRELLFVRQLVSTESQEAPATLEQVEEQLSEEMAEDGTRDESSASHEAMS